MNCREIIDVQLDSMFGATFPKKIQQLVDDELNQGRWVDGYDIAVSNEPLGENEAQSLLSLVLKHYPDFKIDKEILLEIVEQQLPQSCLASVSWIVHESGAYALSDTLRVARFEKSQVVWRSPRISLDGIWFSSLNCGKLEGLAWVGSSSVRPDSPFVLDFETGELLQGQIFPE
ncbi:MAG: hypothetical protein AAGC74_08140 [Verrucomicrobiota bacterium]